MDLCDGRDLWRAVLKCQRARALDNKDPGPSTSVPKADVSRGNSSVSNVPRNSLFTEEQVQSFQVVGDH